jgi:hypothetical protein
VDSSKVVMLKVFVLKVGFVSLILFRHLPGSGSNNMICCHIGYCGLTFYIISVRPSADKYNLRYQSSRRFLQ